MDGPMKVTPEALRRAWEADYQQLIQAVAGAVEAAPDGFWIAASEEVVREAVAVFRQRAYEQALQLKIAAAEGAFSPSGARRQAAV